MIKRFDLTEIINQPVRKLSLGQRMKCEIVLSLLHNPKILFLDEPTIGLDIMVKKNIRELIREINEKEKITIILTSHDMQDIEKICKRAIIINKGTIVYDGKIKDLRRDYIRKKTIKVLTENPIIIPKAKGFKTMKKSTYAARIEISLKGISIKNAINMIMKKNQVLDLNIEEPQIEDIIEEVYRR